MGFRVRKSFKIAPGVRMTVTPRGIGVSAGVKGARISANTSGRVTRTVGIPGTGIYNVSTVNTRRVGPSTALTTGAPSKAAPPAPGLSPGLFAPAWEKALYRALKANTTPARLRSIAQEYEPARPTAALMESIGLAQTGDEGAAVVLLRWLDSIGYAPEADAFLEKYFPGAVFSVALAEDLSVSLPLSEDFVALLLADSLKACSDPDGAIAVLEKRSTSGIVALSLAALYVVQERWDDVMRVTDVSKLSGVIGDDLLMMNIYLLKGIALRGKGFPSASRVWFDEVVKRPKTRPASLRHLAQIERGLSYLDEGKKTMARKAFEKVQVEDGGYPGLQEYLDRCEIQA